MKNVLIFVVGAVAGAAAGSFATYKYVEKKYKQIADEEIASVVERFSNRNKPTENHNNYAEEEKRELVNEPKVIEESAEFIEYKEMIDNLNYHSLDLDTEKTEDDTVAPYLITPEEFGDEPGYDTKTFTWYSDNVLADDDDLIVSDYDLLIGDALDHFDDFADKAVFVRNENELCDYEILKYDLPFGNNGSN